MSSEEKPTEEEQQEEAEGDDNARKKTGRSTKPVDYKEKSDRQFFKELEKTTTDENATPTSNADKQQEMTAASKLRLYVLWKGTRTQCQNSS